MPSIEPIFITKPMSLYDWIALFERERRLFVSLLIAGIVLTWLGFTLQPVQYSGTTLLTVTRTAVENTPDYRYDQFYRFQADERLAESLTQYLMSSVGRQSVAEAARLDGASFTAFTQSKLHVARLGTNLLSVEYHVSSREEAEQVAEALFQVANRFVVLLNEDARERSWFTVLGESPVIEVARLGMVQILLIGSVIGLLVAFWVVLLRHFWWGYREHSQSSINNQT